MDSGTRVRRFLIISAAAAALLGACATTPKAEWVPREGANLSSDERECKIQAAEMNINQPRDYDDGRYGPAAAMASRYNQAQAKRGAEGRLQDLIFEDCMTRKGWVKR